MYMKIRYLKINVYQYTISVEEACGRENWTSSRATLRLRRRALRGRQRPAGPLAANLDYVRVWVLPGR